MTQIHESRPSTSDFVETVWRTRNTGDGTYRATPDGAWDLILGADKHGNRCAFFTGQATKPIDLPYEAGGSSVVISFAASVYLPQLPSTELVDTFLMLRNVDDDHFEAFDNTYPYVSFSDAESLVDLLVRDGVIENDELVADVLSGKSAGISERTAQRHFARSTGLTHKQLQQIRRAQHAVRLLQQGTKPVDAAVEAGYSDQPHLAKSLKRIMDSKPSSVDDIHKL